MKKVMRFFRPSSFAEILTILIIMVFVVSFILSDTKIFFTMSGDRLGEPIRILPKDGFFIFSVGTKKSKNVTIKKITVKFLPDEGIELLEDPEKTSRLETTSDRNFPLAIIFPGPFDVIANDAIGFGFRYKVNRKIEHCKLKFEVEAKISDWEWGFPLLMFPPKGRLESRIVKFAPIGYDINTKEDWLRKYGFKIGPKSGIHLYGEAAKLGYEVITEGGSVELRCYGILKGEEASKDRK